MFYELENTADGQQKMRFQLFVDINDGMQKLIEPWSLEKSKVIEHAVAVKGGSKADYTIRGRLVTNPAESHIVWLLRRRLGKNSTQICFSMCWSNGLLTGKCMLPMPKCCRFRQVRRWCISGTIQSGPTSIVLSTRWENNKKTGEVMHTSPFFYCKFCQTVYIYGCNKRIKIIINLK